MNLLMSWLLKYEGYPPGVVVALLLHGLLLYILLPSDIQPAEFKEIKPPSIAATMSPDNPQRLRRIEQLETQRRTDQVQQRARDEARAREQQQQQARETEARQAAEAETRRRNEAEAQAQRQREEQQAEARRQEEERLAAQAREAEERRRQEQAARDRAAEEEAARVAAETQSNSTGAEADLVSQYAGLIHDIISRNWSQPPSARNGMTAVINLQLVPTGEVVSSVIVQSSGDAAFDRSALQAVTRAGGFPELRELPISVFERNFRNFNLQFTPEDLLR